MFSSVHWPGYRYILGQLIRTIMTSFIHYYDFYEDDDDDDADDVVQG